ncbi:MAG: class I SAM-dependent methyltransferase [Spirochaetota bacterium]
MTNDSDKINLSESVCPLCVSEFVKEIYDNHISLFKCCRCGIIFNAKHRNAEYDDSYFTSQYKDQYGKTYLEDFNSIYSVSIRRIKRILKIIKNTGKISLLDIGSAMGFFLKAASDSGIKDVLGIEISEYASKYCAEKLQLNVINSSFDDVNIPEMFDIITAWYFLEHAADPSGAVKKISKSIKRGGVFAFSTPSFFGPQFLFDRSAWFKTHPFDHRIDFSPGTVKKFLKGMGFRTVYVFPGGIHPERIISQNSVFFMPFKTVYSGISRLLSFSDTIEVYAVK